MDIISSFWEKLSKKLAKYENITSVAGFIFLALTAFTLESGKPLGFIMFVLCLWCFGIVMVVKIFLPDEYGNSHANGANPIMRFLQSSFYAVWFAFLIFMTFILYGKA